MNKKKNNIILIAASYHYMLKTILKYSDINFDMHAIEVMYNAILENYKKWGLPHDIN